MIVSTTPTLQGHEITEYRGIVCGEVVIGAHL
ncbi:heavy metal-binding domain-containing protein, partial [Hyphomonas sp. UBA2515]